MRSLIHTVYRRGASGISNLVMSIELGVVLAALTDRVLILKGNTTPPANVVDYGKIITNRHRSKITDLIDLGVPWIDAELIDLTRFAPYEICDRPSWEAVFYFPSNLDIESEDFQAFAQDRKTWVTVKESMQDIPAISFSGDKDSNTLSFYSCFFYLDHAAQIRAVEALRGMRPKPVYEAFANRIAADIGTFNAVHIRRGDFKITTGVTTLERKPTEAIAAMDNHFARDDRLVILTDEADDPFFKEIKKAYPDHIFLDHHILREYKDEFLDLPAHDSICLAYLSQLVAAQSQDFIGTMTSTFTSLIQRMRGNRGLDEPFKFLWNELPTPGDKLSPGRHAPSDVIPIKNGVMVEQREGPYSWNRYYDRINKSWMREWPESLRHGEAMLERALSRSRVSASTNNQAATDNLDSAADGDFRQISFLDSSVTAGSNDEGMVRSIGELFELMADRPGQQIIGNVRMDVGQGEAELQVNGKEVDRGGNDHKLLRSLYRHVVRQFIYRYPELVWIHAGCAANDSNAMVLPGSWGRGKSTLVLELLKRDWKFMSDDVVPIDPRNGTAIPFPGTPQFRSSSKVSLPRDQLGRLSKSAVQLERDCVMSDPANISAIVFPYYSAEASLALTPLAPAQAVGELLENCLSFPSNSDKTIQACCDVIAPLPIFRLDFKDHGMAADLIIEKFAERQ